jgi:hypothetical protein
MARAPARSIEVHHRPKSSLSNRIPAIRGGTPGSCIVHEDRAGSKFDAGEHANVGLTMSLSREDEGDFPVRHDVEA